MGCILFLLILKLILTFCFKKSAPAHSFSVNIDFHSSLHESDTKFLSLALDASVLKNHFYKFDFKSKKLQTLAGNLAPSDVRIGGTYADFLEFDPEGDDSPSYHDVDGRWEESQIETDDEYLDHISLVQPPMKKFRNYTFTGKLWDKAIHFTTRAGWDLMFDFNLFRWRDGLWDPSNAHKLLKYSAVRGYPLKAFQLGNEPNSFYYNFNFSIPASTLVKDFHILKASLARYPQYRKNNLYGPDVTNLNRHASSRAYLQQFVSAGGDEVVSEISLHHYYLNGRKAKAYEFYKLSVLDSLKEELAVGLKMAAGSRIRLTETSSCYGGGAPGLSDRYVAGFLWLDKLGLAAKFGVTRVFRQTFFGGSYSLVNSELDPNPDYFLSLLHKRLIAGRTFNATTEPDAKHFRIYAHCTRVFGQYKKGAITLAFLNVRDEPSLVSLGQFFDLDIDLYILTPGDAAGLTSKLVKLNGKPLVMSGSELPDMQPKRHRGVVKIPGLSFGFIIVPDAQVLACMK